jgi:hypothetical protein
MLGVRVRCFTYTGAAEKLLPRVDLEGGNAGKTMIACMISGLISGGRVFGWNVL